MTLQRRAKVDRKPFFGFGEDGRCFYSATEADNAPTRFAIALVGSIRAGYLGPMDVVVRLSREPEFLRRPWNTALVGNWSTLTRWDEWPVAWASNPLTEFVRSHGGSYPWVGDPWAWRKSCEAAAAHHGYVVRVATPGDVRGMLEGIGL